MNLHPGVLALMIGSFLTTAMVCYCARIAVTIIRNWDIRSGSERQLKMERQTYLISLVMSYALGFELLSLFLFIFTADAISPLFVGAMCAAGSLNVNEFGYPALVLKIIDFLLSGVWLIVNTTDNRAADYPLIRIKYVLLLCIVPFLLAETITQAAYLIRLKPDVITSCCGTIFTTDTQTTLSELIRLPRALSQTVFLLSMAITLGLGLMFVFTGRGSAWYSLSTLISFPVSVMALISFISIYIYELPTHHCPFCLLHSEYGGIGYPIYVFLLSGTVCGLGVGSLAPFRRIPSLCGIIPGIQKKLAGVSVVSLSMFLIIAGWAIAFSHLSLDAYG